MAKQTQDFIQYPELDCFNNESIGDVVFVVEGQRLSAIKQILFVKSRVFRDMFPKNYKQKVGKPIIKVIKETTFEAFKIFIWFLYSEQLTLNNVEDFKQIEDICKLSEKYEVVRVLDKVADHLKTNIRFNNLKSISRIAFKYNIEELMAKVIEFMENNINHLIHRDSEELFEINENTENKLYEVLTSDHLQKDPEHLVNFYIKGKKLKVSKEYLEKKNVLKKMTVKKRGTLDEYLIQDTNFMAFRVLIGFIYFGILILSNGELKVEDFELIREGCKLADRYNLDSFFTQMQKQLGPQINYKTIKMISKIAFDYNIEELITKVRDFIKSNINELVDNPLKELVDIDSATHNSLMEVMQVMISQNIFN